MAIDPLKLLLLNNMFQLTKKISPGLILRASEASTLAQAPATGDNFANFSAHSALGAISQWC